jgi:multiple sugar transport system permease protein
MTSPATTPFPLAEDEIFAPEPPLIVPYRRVSPSGVLTNLVLAAFGVAFVTPLLWMVLSSFDAHANWSVKLPTPTLHNYGQIIWGGHLHAFYNSFYLAGVSTVITTVLALLAGYALSRHHIPLKRSTMIVILFASGLPVTMLLVPTFQLYVKFGWLDSLFTTSLFIAASSLPFAIWLLKNFVDQVPRELEEAAQIEGAGTLQTLVRVVVPLALPGIAVTAIVVFINGWGAFVIPLVLNTNPHDQPGSIAIYQFLGAYGAVHFGPLAAFSLLFSLPVLALYLIASRQLSGAFSFSGGLKG